MSTVKQVVGSRTSVTVSGLSTLASAGYATSSTVNNTTNQPLDLLVELAATPGTTTGNMQAVLYAQASLDGTNWQSGASTSADEADATLIGILPLAVNSTLQRLIFPVAINYGGILPPYIRFVVKNDSGAAFTAGTIYVSEVSTTVA